MRYYFDTEFYEHDDRVEPISIGVVCEDGREFYAEFRTAKEVAKMTPWLAENVAPHLTGEIANPLWATLQIQALVGPDPSPEFWAFWGAYDWVVLCQLWGGMLKLPKTWVYKLKEFADLGIRISKFEGQHNALNDARALQRAVTMR